MKKKFYSILFCVVLIGHQQVFPFEILRQPLINSFLNASPSDEFSSILDEESYRELDVAGMAKKIDQTKTPFGHWALQKFIHPLNDQQEILRRQQAIKFLIDHPDILHDFQEQLKIVSEHCRCVIDYWDLRTLEYGFFGPSVISNNEIHRNAENLYFSFFGLAPKSITNFMNTNPTILSSAQLFTVGQSLFFLGGAGFYAARKQEVDLCRATHHQFSWQHAFTDLFLAPLRKLYWKHSIYSDGKYEDNAEKTTNAALSLMTFADICTFHMNKDGSSKIVAGLHASYHALSAAGIIGIACYSLISQMKYLKSLGLTIQALHANMVSVALSINAMQDAIDQAIACGLVHEPKNCLATSASISEKLKKLLALLKTPTLQSTDFAIHQGRILAAHQLMRQVKQELIPLLQAIGELDLYCAVTQQIQDNKLCFVDFVKTDNAFINLKEFNNILLPAHKSVANDIYLGNGQPHNIIFSGPLGSGKSVVIKGVILNIILAQSLGIAAAASAQISLFDRINIYLNVRDNIGTELSTGMAEYKKLQAIVDAIIRLPAHQKSLTYIDEALKGTFGEDGAETLHEMGQKIASATNNISLIATHYQKPTELEQAAQGHFANCHLEILEPLYGLFERTFKIKPGINDWWFSDQEKRKRYRDWIMQLDHMKAVL